MTDRTVKVSLILAAQGYMSGMAAVQQKTAQTGSEIEKLNQKRQAFTQLGTAAIGFGAAMGVGVGMAIAKWAEFDQQMSYVQAATHETTANMALLKDAAIDAGARTVFSASEAAGAIEELAKAGVSTRDILSGGLDSALDLAAAGGLDVGEAAGIAAVALRTFNLEGADMAHVADLLAAGAGKAMGDVAQLGAALSQGGQVAKQTGLSIEETTAGLAAFASQGLIGSDAGTSFKSMLQRLTPQSAEARDKMRELGISAYDASGNFIGLADFAGNLRSALRDLTPEQRNSALATIFGSDAVRAASVLYDEGARGIREWITAVDDQGYAAETAALRLDNLKGDWEALTGSIDSALITMGEGGDGPARFFVQTLDDMVDMFNALPDGAQQAATWIAAAAAAVGIASGTFLVAVPKVVEYREALKLLGTTAQRTSNLVGIAMKGLGTVAGIGLALAIVNQLDDALNGAGVSAKELSNAITKGDVGSALQKSLQGSGSWFANQAGVMDQARRGFEDLGAAIDAVSGSMDTRWAGAATMFVDWIDGSIDPTDNYRDALNKLGEALASMPADQASQSLRKLQAQYRLTSDQLSTLIDNSGPYREALVGQIDDAGLLVNKETLLKFALADSSAALADSSSATEDNSRALAELSGSAQSAMYDIDGVSDAIRGFGEAAYGTRDAARGFEQAIDDLEASIKENGKTLDVSTQKGRENEEALDDIARSTIELVASMNEQGASQEELIATMDRGRQAFIDGAIAAGTSREAAELLADQLGLIPTNVPVAFDLNTDDAQRKLDEFVISITNRQATLNVRVQTAIARGASNAELMGMVGVGLLPNARGAFYERGKIKEFAAGGFASGIYPATTGGIHKFAEAGHDEAYITMDPAYADRSRAIWEQVGVQLGVWNAAPQMTARAWQSAPGQYAAVATASTAPAEIYVQNPWGPEYMQAKTVEVADARIKRYDGDQQDKSRRGYIGGL